MSGLKIAFVALLGVLLLTSIYLPRIFPYPDPRHADASPIEYADAKFKVTILHQLVYAGVFLLGSQLIYSKFLILCSPTLLFSQWPSLLR